MENKVIVVFDGVCNLCNRFVDFLIRRDISKSFLFVPLQDINADSQLKLNIKNIQHTVIAIDQMKWFEEADAIRYILHHTRGNMAWRFFLNIAPNFLLIKGYRFVSKKRYRFFGKRRNCRLPNEDEKTWFLSAAQINDFLMQQPISGPCRY